MNSVVTVKLVHCPESLVSEITSCMSIRMLKSATYSLLANISHMHSMHVTTLEVHNLQHKYKSITDERIFY